MFLLPSFKPVWIVVKSVETFCDWVQFDEPENNEA